MPKQVHYGNWVNEQRDKNSVDLEMPDGTVINIPPPALWSKEVTMLAQRDTADPDDVGRALLGAEQFDRFLDAGGTSMALSIIVQTELGTRLGE